MSRCLDLLSHAADFIIAYGTIYDFLVSSINHAGRLDHIFALGFTGGMTQRIDRLSHAADYVTTDFAVNYFVVATLDSAGGFNLVLTNRFGRYMTFLFNLLGFGCIAYQAGKGLYAILSAGGSSGYTAFVPLMSICRNLFNSGKYCVANAALGSGGVTLLGTGCVFWGNRNSGMHMPDAAVLIVVYGRSGFHSGSLKICTVRVAQLRGGNCEFLAVTATVVLISCCLGSQSALLNILTSTALGANVCTACSRINSTDRSKSTVYIDLCISKIGIRAIVRLAGSICYRFEFARTPNKVIGIPFIGIININALFACHGKTGAFSNVHLNACQKRGILIDGDTTGINVYGNVVRYRKNITCGVDAHSGKLQRQSVQFRLTIYRKDKAISVFIIILCKTAGLDIEHSATTNKVYSCGVC